MGNGGKLTKTHIDNLNKDKIFDSVPKPDIDAGEVRLPRSVDSGESDTPLADRSNLRLSGRDAYDPTNTSSISPNKIGSIDSAKTLERRGMTAAPVSVPTPVSESPYVGGPEGLEGVNYEIPQGEFGENYSSVSLPSENFDGAKICQSGNDFFNDKPILTPFLVMARTETLSILKIRLV